MDKPSRRPVPKVCQYTKTGKFIRDYPSGYAAAKELGISSTSIYHCCNGKAFSAGGFVWRFEGVEPVMRERQKPGTEGRPVCQYTRTGEFVRQYPNTVTAAREIGLCLTGITNCCRHRKLSAGDFVWRYADEPPVAGAFPVPVPRCRPVCQCNRFGQTIRIYDSAKTAEQQTGISAASICRCCKGKNKSAGGYIWRYSEQSEN